MRAKTVMCIRCGRVAKRHAMSTLSMCEPCARTHIAEGKRAAAQVHIAIRRGLLRPAREHGCSDCTSQARAYDHRDYLRPLAVEPVCRRCNYFRGFAFDSVVRPAGEQERPVFTQLPDLRRRHNRIEARA